jgi:tight adherence protein C
MSATILILFMLGIGGAAWLTVSWALRSRAIDRIRLSDRPDAEGLGSGWTEPTGLLARWLYLAGYRTPAAPVLFIGLTAACAGLGGFAALAASRAGLVALLAEGFIYIPGGLGEALAGIAGAAPWILVAVIASAPVLIVRASRRRRVQQAEEDLPLLLELLASLAEGGLGFDAALGKILHAQPLERSLPAEIRTFQAELRVGVGRVQALRRLAWRLDIPAVSSFVSALVHAEQVGASLAETLRYQSGDLRNARRERVLLQAQALPVKLVFPLVICFLPSIFITTLGPALYQLTKVLNLSTFRGTPLP